MKITEKKLRAIIRESISELSNNTIGLANKKAVETKQHALRLNESELRHIIRNIIKEKINEDYDAWYQGETYYPEQDEIDRSISTYTDGLSEFLLNTKPYCDEWDNIEEGFGPEYDYDDEIEPFIAKEPMDSEDSIRRYYQRYANVESPLGEYCRFALRHLDAFIKNIVDKFCNEPDIYDYDEDRFGDRAWNH